MPYKLALHALVRFTEQVVPIHKHITLFWNFLDIRNKNSHNETNEKGSGDVIWPNSHYMFIEYLTGHLESAKLIQAFCSTRYA